RWWSSYSWRHPLLLSGGIPYATNIEILMRCTRSKNGQMTEIGCFSRMPAMHIVQSSEEMGPYFPQLRA
ncbi:MAG: hypothetical protein AB7G34_06745, partial [Hyphomicrobiales bacterium]